LTLQGTLIVGDVASETLKPSMWDVASNTQVGCRFSHMEGLPSLFLEQDFIQAALSFKA
jgi:hypothetical protein